MIRLLFRQNGGKFTKYNRNISNLIHVGSIGPTTSQSRPSQILMTHQPLSNLSNKNGKRLKSSMPIEASINENTAPSSKGIESIKKEIKKNKALSKEVNRLIKMRNVGVFAHVDAGKTTVTERMITLAGFVNTAGSVDSGNTVTDHLPMERERGISIQSAAISFDWGWHTQKIGDDDDQDEVNIHLIDTPGHIDFSVEVNRSVAVLDGAVLVVDAVAGVQAQTYTVWKAISQQQGDFSHEALPCVAVINKMDKEEANFAKAMATMRNRLPSANPMALHLPLFRSDSAPISCLEEGIFAVEDASVSGNGNFAGVIDIVHMRAIVWPDIPSNKLHVVENCLPKIINLMHVDHTPIHPECQITHIALQARHKLIEQLANIDPAMEECFLLEVNPSNAEIRNAIRRVTLERKAVPVLAAAALKAKGIEPVLDSIADYLPSPLDRLPPALSYTTNKPSAKSKSTHITPGHPLHSSLIAFAFKVVHLKGRAGSGDGRVVFVRVYSGSLKTKDAIRVMSADNSNTKVERVTGMLQLNPSGRYENLDDGICRSGDVAALVGLKNVKTGDTIHLSSDKANAYLAGVSSPKPVLTIRIEAQNTEDEAKLSSALQLLSIEDPSLHVSEDPDTNATLLSGLGELHIEIILDRLFREFGLEVNVGTPAVAYKETITSPLNTLQSINYDKTFGNVRMQASIHFIVEPVTTQSTNQALSHIFPLSDPIVTIEPKARQFLQIKDDKLSENELYYSNDLVKSLIMGCVGSLKRGVVGPYSMANLHCRVVDIHSDLGYKGLIAAPNTLRAASSHILSNFLKEQKDECCLLEPIMSMEVMSPRSSIGTVLNDLVKRRGNVDDVFIPDETWNSDTSMAMVRGNVPLKEILGYANSLRSLTGGEGTFTAEYLGHTTAF